MSDERPTGQRYSLVYGERGEPDPDNERFRARLAAFLNQEGLTIQRGEIPPRLHQELGVTVPTSNLLYDYDANGSKRG